MQKKKKIFYTQHKKTLQEHEDMPTSFSLAHLMKSDRNFMTEALASLWSSEQAAMAQHSRGLHMADCKKDSGDLCTNLQHIKILTCQPQICERSIICAQWENALF